MTKSKPIINRVTLGVFSEFLSKYYTLESIHTMFARQGFHVPNENIRRRAQLVTHFQNQVKDNNLTPVKLLNVYNQVLTEAAEKCEIFKQDAQRGKTLRTWFTKLINSLKNDGFSFVDGRIVASHIVTVNLNGDVTKEKEEEACKRKIVEGQIYPSVVSPASSLIASEKNTYTPSNCTTILHLSDLHFSADVKPMTKLQWLCDDLKSLQVNKLDFIVISGDFTDKGRNEGFPRAVKFIKELCHRYKVDLNEKCLVVPGNHDVQDVNDAYDYVKEVPSGTPKGHYYEKGKLFAVRNDSKHKLRFASFSDNFYKALFGCQYPLDPEKQGIIRTFEENGLQFWLFNSAWELDEFDRGRITINQSAMAQNIKKADEYDPHRKLLRIGVWHHAIRAAEPNKPIRNPSFFESHLQKNGVKIGLHGDVHRMERNWIGYWHQESSLHIVGAGSFASPDVGIEHATPRLYNLLVFKKDLSAVRVHTRAQPKQDGAWQGWSEWPSRDNNDPARYPYFDVDFRR